MPYVPEDPNNQQQQQNGGQQSNVNNETVLSGGAGGGTAGSGGSGQQASQRGQSPSNFTNINQYLGANQAQASNLQNQVVGKVEQAGQNAQNAITSGENSFANQVNAGANRPDQNYATNTAQNAVSVYNSPDQKTQAQKVYAGQYGGPTQRDTTQETQAVQTALPQVQALQNSAGRQSLLQQQFNRPDYGYGQQTLDNALLSGSQGAAQRFAGVQNQYGNLNNLLGTSVQNSGNAVTQAEADTQAAAKQLADAYGTQQSGIMSALQGQQTQSQQTQDQAYQKLLSDIQNRTLDDSERSMLGLQSGQALYNANLPGYLSEQAAPTVGGVATADQRAQLQALAGLQGQDLTAINPNEAAYNPNSYANADTAAIQAAIQSGQGQYNDALKNTYLNPGSALYNITQNQGLSAQDAYNQLLNAHAIGNTAGGSNSFSEQNGLSSPAFQSPTNPNMQMQANEVNRVKQILDQLYGANQTV